MPIEPGTKLGHYEIVAPLGAGGMGEVYRARDTRLDRTVAIKVLPQHLSDNVELRQRFEQEARACSSLNHPNICTLHDIHLRQASGGQVGYDLDIDFMVMECIEGETLADRLQRGPLPIDEALRCARAIGDALDKAHRQRIVHRDLKPGNVMLTKSGPKLLDFGLAKLQTNPQQEPDLSAVTEQKPLTEKGAILGTFQYMAPEQLEGGETDARTDIFAFGVLLYEIVTGQKAFSGKSQASLISAILSSEPRPISELRPATPKSIDRIVHRCLAKDPEDRWQSTRDVVLELSSDGVENETRDSSTPASRTGERLAWSALVLAVAVIAGVWVKPTTGVTDEETTRVTIPLTPNEQLLGGSAVAGAKTPFDISSDGRTIVFASERGGDAQLYVRQFNEYEFKPISGTQRASAPLFSPDGQWVGFVADRELLKIPADGGTAIKIADISSFDGWSWSSDGWIVLAGAEISRVTDSGTRLETVKEADPNRYFALPQVLPGGRDILVTIKGGQRGREQTAVVSGTGEVRTLLEGFVGARYVPTGHLVLRDLETDDLSAVRFDLATLEVHGEPVPVVENVYASPRSGYAHFAISETGALVYTPRGSGSNALVWVNRDGSVSEALDIPTGAYTHTSLSPDGRQVVVDNLADGYRDVWVYDIARGSRTRLTAGDDGSYGLGTWTPDGERVTFFSTVSGKNRLYSRVADAGAEAARILEDSDLARFPISWSPDGHTLAFAEAQSAGDRDIHLVRDGEVAPFASTSFHELSPKFSPNGRFIAYVSNDSGRPEVYVRPYPDGDQKWPISTEGGAEPVWSRDGRELFYRDRYKMFVVPVEFGSSFRAGRPNLLFEAPYFVDSAGHPAYDVSADGQRFLMIQDTEDERTQLNVVFNWFQELERLVPTE